MMYYEIDFAKTIFIVKNVLKVYGARIYVI